VSGAAYFPVAVALVSAGAALIGLRGLRGAYLPIPVSLGLAIVALAAALIVRRSGTESRPMLFDVALAVAIVACCAAFLAAVSTSYL
jgi:hypothetical protein